MHPVHLLQTIDLIDRQSDGLALFVQNMGHLPIDLGHPYLSIDHENQGIGLFDRHLSLPADRLIERHRRARVDPARVDHLERAGKKSALA